MAFRDLTDVLGATKSKELPIHGRLVAFPGTISAWAGQLLLAVRRAAEDAAAAGSSDAEVVDLVTSGAVASEEDAVRLERELLGDEGAAVLDELGVIGDARQRIVGTLTVWHLSGQEAAELAWEGKAQPPNRAARRRTAGRSSQTAGTGRGSSRTAVGGSSGRRTTVSRGTRS